MTYINLHRPVFRAIPSGRATRASHQATLRCPDHPAGIPIATDLDERLVAALFENGSLDPDEAYRDAVYAEIADGMKLLGMGALFAALLILGWLA